jgi:hypothetical protein
VFVFDSTRTSRRAMARVAVVLACLVVVALGAVTWAAGALVAVAAFWSVSAILFVALLHFEPHALGGDDADSLGELADAERKERVAA